MGILVYDEIWVREPRLMVPGQVPIGNVVVERSHPLAQGLHVCVPMNTKKANIDIARGVHGSFGGSNPAFARPGYVYKGHPSLWNYAIAAHLNVPGAPIAKHSFTYLLVACHTADYPSIWNMFCGHLTGNNGPRMYHNNSASNELSFVLGGVAAYTSTLSIPIDQWYSAMVAFDASANVVRYSLYNHETKEYGTDSDNTSASWNNGDGTYSIMQYGSEYSSVDLYCSLACVWLRALNDAERKEACSDPWQITRPA